ncbi:MAG TPA: dihydroneopterin aldolase [Candidatus Marinimicrobia bacterium]|nr:dihydroneopterin aldolase [Candidatus Neomarinimicrobiota bacterium]|tara:strand:+ start:1789 stop:2151 length:363 start_codon:yes stop_codon:yes gene_type:complete
MEKIAIKDIKLVGFHGLYENEKRDGINLSFDIELYFKDEINNNFDDIEKTINYIEVIDLVKRINSSANFDLIETLCNRILSEIMELYSPLKSTVRVRKYKLPIDTKLNCVEVEMTKENNV